MIYWIWLNTIDGLGPVMQRKLLNHFKNPKNIFDADEYEIMKVKNLGIIRAKEIKNTSLEKSKEILDKCEKNKVKILSIYDDLYPNQVKNIISSPTLLYYKGEIRKNIMGVGIVGSRRCTSYGKTIAIEAASYLAKNNITVISGMAKGIDGYAHTACLKAGGYTVAFLGSSPDVCYPKEHNILMESIIENGAVISEYPPETKALSKHFPKRNFLISSFSQKLLVVEAAQKSGALITAHFSSKINRKVFAVPNNIYQKTSSGTNNLILEGAKIYLNPEQLLEDEHILKSIKKFEDINQIKLKSENQNYKNNINSKLKNDDNFDLEKYSSKEKMIIESIKEGTKFISEIMNDTNLNEREILELISILELEGVVRSIPGGRWKIT